MALLSPAGPGSTPLEHRASLASLYQHLDMNPADADLYEQMDALAMTEDPKVMTWKRGIGCLHATFSTAFGRQ